MSYIKYLLLTFTLTYFMACNSTKEPKKQETKESNTTTVTVIVKPPTDNFTKKQKIVQKELNTYLNELATFNTDAIVDMTYPKLFLVIDLDLYRQYIASMMNSTDIEIRSYESNVTKLSKITTFSNDTEFAQADYISTILIHFINNNLYASEEKINFLYDALIHKYGRENIHINLKERTLQIKKSEKLLIIKEKDTSWKFLGDNSKYRQLYPSFLPQEILKIIHYEGY